MSKLRVLIVGASIAGPTAAYWFARAGAQVTVIERFPSLRLAGQGIDIRGPGVSVMRKMPGMEAAVRAKTTTLEGISLVDTYDRPYGVLRATGNPDQQSLVSEYEIFRGDLGKILYDMTSEDEDVKYVFDEQLASIQQNQKEDGPVHVEFANGNLPNGEYDLVVACDGATSRTRAMGLGCGVHDHLSSVNSWTAYFSLNKDIMNGGKIGHGYNGVGGRFMAIGPDPAGFTRVTFMRVYSSKHHDATIPFREAVKQGDNALKRYVTKEFEGAGWRTDELIEGLMEGKDFYASEIGQVKTPSLSKGRFVMVGDAGYAPGPTGGGTSLALTGAYVLAGEICKAKGDLTAGLAGYERTMRPIITELQKIPYGVLSFLAPQTAWAIWIRNNVFAIITWTRLLEYGQKYLGSAFAANEYKLPDYEWVRK